MLDYLHDIITFLNSQQLSAPSELERVAAPSEGVSLKRSSRWTAVGAASTVLQSLYWTAVVQRLSFSIFQSMYGPTIRRGGGWRRLVLLGADPEPLMDYRPRDPPGITADSPTFECF